VDTEAVPRHVLTILPGTDRTVILTDDQSGAVGWHVHASGAYDFASGLVTTVVGVPRTGGRRRVAVAVRPQQPTAPSPLAYFAIGTAFCYHTQLCRYVDVRRMPVSSSRLVQVSTLVSDGTTAEDRPFDTHLFLRGSVDDEQTRSLLLAAADTCYAHRALSVDIETKRTISVRPSTTLSSGSNIRR
jgi:uncharacterized OsmC-like protein